MLQLPSVAMAVPSTVVPSVSNKVTLLPTSAVPVMVGVALLVKLSVLLLPLSEAGAKASSAGLAGAVRSIVISRGVDATEALPAKSVATTLKLYVPSVSGVVTIKVHRPLSSDTEIGRAHV